MKRPWNDQWTSPGAVWANGNAAAPWRTASANASGGDGNPATPWKKPKGTLSKALGKKEPFQRKFIETDGGDVDEIWNLREELHIAVEGAAAEARAPITSFEELGVLPDYVMQALRNSGRQTPMPIQAQALPIILAGLDIIGIAKTGSGKTLAFLLPAIVHMEAQKPLSQDDTTPIVLILAPTRELVAQIAEEAAKLLEHSTEGSHPRGIWAQEVYGGKLRQAQLMKSKGAALIAATPGRLADFVNSGDMTLDRVTYFVLDEADRMLDMGFQEDIQNFSSSIRADRHTLFFSATWPTEVQELATSLCQNSQQPVIIKVGQRDNGAGATRADITQTVVVFDQWDWSERENAKKSTSIQSLA
jgi:ATP-dependent RNA helicase DDX5/DBP2